MEELLKHAAAYVSWGLQAIALLLIVVGAVETMIAMGRVMLNGHAVNAEKRAVWLEFAHWLVAALTFQLAADIVQTTVAPSWDDVGRVAAIAAIRTFLTFSLDRDIDAVRERKGKPKERNDDDKRT